MADLSRTTSSALAEMLQGGRADELKALKIGGLSRQCRGLGIGEEELEDLQDEDEPKQALIRWILAHEVDPLEDLRTQLGELKLGALSRRARAAGVDDETLEDAQDADDAKAAVVELILGLGLEAAAAVLATASTPRPGGLSATPPPMGSVPMTPRAEEAAPPSPPAAPAPAEAAPAATVLAAPAPAEAPSPAPVPSRPSGAAPVAPPAAAIQLWVKTSTGTISITANNGTATTVAQIRAQIAEKSQVDMTQCRLIFAGRELEDTLTLAAYNCEAASELNLILRVNPLEQAAVADASVDREAEAAIAAIRATMRGKKLGDFKSFTKIGGKDIQAAGGGGYSQSGVCSYVYLTQMRGGNGMQLALKVMLNYCTADNTLALSGEFDAETALLSDPKRLPPHRHVMAVLHSFADVATSLPGWDFDPTIVMPHTFMVVMPFFEKDLKAVFRSTRRHGENFSDVRASRISYHLLLAVRHLKSYGIVHRDIKLDNVLLANVGTDQEAAVLTDFGMCFDLRKNRVSDWKVEMKFDGFRRGGAPIALAPEVSLPKPGPDAFLDYSRNDEWAVGMVSHELFSKSDAQVPFDDMEHPASYTDAGYTDEGIANNCKPFVKGLLRVAVADRLDAVEASRDAKQLLGQLVLEEALQENSGEYKSGAIGRMDTAIQRSYEEDPGATGDTADARQALEAQKVKAVAAVVAVLGSGVEMPTGIKMVQVFLDDHKDDRKFVEAAWVALDQHRLALVTKMKRKLEVAAQGGDPEAIQAAIGEAADYGEAVQAARQGALAALGRARARDEAVASVTKAEGLLASKNFKQAIDVFKEAAASATEAADGRLQAHVADRLKDAEEKAAEAKKRGGASGGGAGARPVPTAAELGAALREAIGIGVPLWNGGDYAGCAAVYKTAVMRFMHADDSLAKAVADCEGKSTGAARDGQGWILRNAMDACLARIRAGSWEASAPKVRCVIVCSDFADHRADVQQHLARGLGVATVPMIDLHAGTPSNETLAQYEVAVVFTASWGAGMMRGFPPTTFEQHAVGDRLADFVDGGGHVVVMYQNPPIRGRWEREQYSPQRHDGIKEIKAGQRADGGEGLDAAGPLWVVGGPVAAHAQVLASWPGSIPFIAINRPSDTGYTLLLNYFPPSNACTAHRVQDRLWNPSQMDGGKLMATAVNILRSIAADGGSESGEEESDAMDVYVQSWESASMHIEKAISVGAPMYNAGHVDECYKYYSAVAKSILRRRPAWKASELYKKLETAVAQSAAQGGEDAGAWTMRKAFDEVIEVVEEMAELEGVALRGEVIGGGGRPLEAAPDGRARLAAEATMEAQQEAGERDAEMAAGTRVWVAGQGEGAYVAFERRVMGKNVHTLKMDSSGSNSQVKLAESYWVVL